jgi:hypothetical protein
VAPTSRQAAAAVDPRAGRDRIPVQPEVDLDVYWRDDDLGRGPAASLYVRGVEVLRLDCFGGDQGHLHLNLGDGVSRRWYFQPGTAAEHIDRACFELERNFFIILSVCRDPAIEGITLRGARMAEVAAGARSRLFTLLAEHQA